MLGRVVLEDMLAACGVTVDKQTGPNSPAFCGRESVGARGRERVTGSDRDPVG